MASESARGDGDRLADVTIPQEAFEELRAFAREGRTGSVALVFRFSEGALQVVDIERRRTLKLRRVEPPPCARGTMTANG